MSELDGTTIDALELPLEHPRETEPMCLCREFGISGGLVFQCLSEAGLLRPVCKSGVDLGPEPCFWIFDRYSRSPERCLLVVSDSVALASSQPLEFDVRFRMFFGTLFIGNPNVEPRGPFPQALVVQSFFLLDAEREDHGKNRRGCTPRSLLHSATSRCTKETGPETSPEPRAAFLPVRK